MRDRPLIIESSSAEQVVATMETTADPTASAVSFDVSTGGDSDPPGNWVPGSWLGSWSARTGRVRALSPTIGVAGAITVAEGTEYLVWLRYGTVIKRVGRISIR